MSGDGIGVYTIAKIINNERIPTKFNDYSGEFKRRDRYTNQYTYFKKVMSGGEEMLSICY